MAGESDNVDLREVVNGTVYVLSMGRWWRYVPKDFPPLPAIPLGFAKRNPWQAQEGALHRPEWPP
jgi:transposase